MGIIDLAVLGERVCTSLSDQPHVDLSLNAFS